MSTTIASDSTKNVLTPKTNYLNASHGLKSWLLTQDHKRIALLYLIGVTFFFIVAHFHFVMVGSVIMGYLAGLHFWWPKITGRMYPEGPAKFAAVLIFVGFFFTFGPQFILGYLGMPRRYAMYPPEWQALNVFSTAGATVMGFGYLLTMIYLGWSLYYGPIAGSNPWRAYGLEWWTTSPPPTENFTVIPIVTQEAYDYASIDNPAVSASTH